MLAYSSMGRVIVLYVSMIVSFCFPHLVEVRAFSMFNVLLAFLHVLLMCAVNVCCVSNVSPRIFVVFSVLSGTLSIFRFVLALYSCESGVRMVVSVLSALSLSWFVFVQLWMDVRIGCISLFACNVLGLLVVIVMSSAYVIIDALIFVGMGMSDM